MAHHRVERITFNADAHPLEPVETALGPDDVRVPTGCRRPSRTPALGGEGLLRVGHFTVQGTIPRVRHILPSHTRSPLNKDTPS